MEVRKSQRRWRTKAGTMHKAKRELSQRAASAGAVAVPPTASVQGSVKNELSRVPALGNTLGFMQPSAAQDTQSSS